MQRRRYLALASTGLALSLAGCSGESDDGQDGSDADTEDDTADESPDDETDGSDQSGDGGDEQEDDGSDEPPRSDADTLLSARELLDREEVLFDPGAETFDGSGEDVIDSFELGPGATIVAFEHDGEGNFIVETEGGSEELLANYIGAIEGATAFPTMGGEYIADIDADGDWSLTIGQPLAPPEEIRTPTVSASGSGPAVVGPVELDGGTTWSATHASDEGNFQVTALLEGAGGPEETALVVNEIGEYDGATRLDATGVVWVDIEADGDWTLEIE